MRIEGMDATIRSTTSVAHTQAKADLPVIPSIPADEKEPTNNTISEAFIRKAVDKANETMKEHNRSLEFRIHEKTNEIIVKIIDTDTKEVIREIPSEKILDMFANMLELAGLIVDERR